ncbi:sensor histidine kinase [Desulfurispira natronophila]|uniref:histidine kinase n=1 Tax=Desulfurispira natronophila TaxID=682562 RepID=A0A7W7Y2B1_9BACT|nr:HAMP domain-containing sensor histidine kinase [Desulfurispira natronophila]MBB5020795.1 signal transduction histidine kinase [Desulfurispira natronophila]
MTKPGCDIALLEYLQQEASMLILYLQPDGKVISCNDFVRKLLGFDPTGSDFEQMLLDFRESFCLQEYLQSGDKRHLLNVPTVHGAPRTFSFRFLQCEDAIVAVGECHFEEEQSVHNSLIQLNSDMANLNRELQKKNSELDRLHELKNHFMGMAAHDLRNPIATIISLCDFLLGEFCHSLSEEHIRLLSYIRTSGNFMLELLNDLLDIARIETGNFGLELQSTDLVALLRRTVDLQQFQARGREVDIQFHFYESPPAISIDPLKIEQVMQNLLSNAVKFSPKGGVVKVGLMRSSDYLLVSIQDQGPGIPEEEQKQVFQPFSMATHNSPAGDKGTGLGLTIVHKIIQSHMGQIWLESSPGKGSTFFFSLPVNMPEG